MGDVFELMQGLRHSDKKPGRRVRPAHEVLHSKMIWTAWCDIEGGEAAISTKFRDRRGGGDNDLAIRSDEISSYKAGSRSLSAGRRAVLAARHPELRRVMEWPMYLFDQSPLRMSLIQRYVRSYLEEGSIRPSHVFPSDTAEASALNRLPVKYFDLERLFERGDDYGFFTLLAAFRIFGLAKERDQQWYAARYLIKAAPGLCRMSAAKPQSESVIDLIESLLVFLPDTSFRLEVDREEMRRQIRAVSHEPCRGMRLAAHNAGARMAAPPDPLVTYSYRRCRPRDQPLLLAGS